MTSDEQRTFEVEGMTCGHCELSVVEEVRELPGVSDASADHASGRLVVSGSAIDEDAVARAVEEAGYRLAR